MKLKKLSLRVRIFIAMILLVLLSSILIAAVATYQYNEERQEYHEKRLDRKERAIVKSLRYVLYETSYEVITEKVPYIFKDEINKTAEIHNQAIDIYDLDGGFLISSKSEFKPNKERECLRAEVLNALSNTCLLYTSPSPRDKRQSRMPSSA